MSKKNYRYSITDRLGNLSVSPLGEADFQITWSKLTDGKSYYKKELPSKIKFINEAYQRLYKLERSIYRCDFIPIMVERRCVTAGIELWAPWFSGRISLNEGNFDLDRCTLELKLSEVQDYSCFDDNKSQEVNLLAILFNKRTVSLSPPDVTLEFLSQEVTTHPDAGIGCGGYAWEGTGNYFDEGWQPYQHNQQYFPYGGTIGGPHGIGETDECRLQTDYARQVISVPCGDPAPGPEWILVSPACLPGDGPDVIQTYAKPANVYNCQYTYPNEGDYNNYTMTCQVVGSDAGPISGIDNGVPLSDVLTYFVNLFCPGLTVKSDFFQINPDIITNINYVTGRVSTVDNVTIYQKSDVKRPSVSGNATIAKMTWEKLNNTLIEMFNCTWRIAYDVTLGHNVFRMEHVKFFDNNIVGLDLTLPRYADFVYHLRRYSYDTPSIPSQEKFTFMESDYYGDFPGLPIIYKDGCVTNTNASSIKNHNVENVTTDVQLCLSNPDPDSSRVSDDGFVFVSARLDTITGIYHMNSESSILGGSVLNNPLAWAQLHRDYHRYNRPLKRGNMNGQPTEFITVIPTKKGEKITIPLCCGDIFDPDKKVLTPLGLGTVSKAAFSFKSETLELDLLYQADIDLTNNAAPIANNDVVSMYVDQTVDIDELANDTDPDPGATISLVEIVLGPTNGTATVLPNKKIRYVPNPGYIGPDMIVYRFYDDWSEPSNNGLIAITVHPVNAGPVAGAIAYSTPKNTALTQAALGVLANSTDDVGFSLQGYTQPAHGSVVVNPDGSFTYTPAAGFAGTDTFTFTIIDDEGLTSTATATINVTDPSYPVANTDTVTATKDTVLTIPAPGVIANDTTTIGSLIVTAETKATAQGGTVTISADGSFVYAPPAGYVGLDSFNYTLSNGTNSVTGLVNIHVNAEVFFDLVYTETSHTEQTKVCGIEGGGGGITLTGGFTTNGKYVLKFYSDSGKTIPFDTTGLGISITIHNKTTTQETEADPLEVLEGDINFPVSGTEYDLYTGVVEDLDKDCLMSQISYYKLEYSTP